MGHEIEAGDRVAFDELGNQQDDHAREPRDVEESEAAVKLADHPGSRGKQHERSGNDESVIEDGDVAHGFGEPRQIPQLARAQISHPDARQPGPHEDGTEDVAKLEQVVGHGPVLPFRAGACRMRPASRRPSWKFSPSRQSWTIPTSSSSVCTA